MYIEGSREMEKSAILKELEHLLYYDTPILQIEDENNNLFIKREDLIPFSFGGNKVRIAANYFIDLIKGGFDSVVTYGASTSNLCRVVAAMAKRYKMQCFIISPEECYLETPNSVMVSSLGSNIIKCPVSNVSETIDRTLEKLRKICKPYFIYGGGHGKIGTDSYRTVLSQIIEFERTTTTEFDYIFVTLATGTSMSGLVVENCIRKSGKCLVGVSVAREVDRARKILIDAVESYIGFPIDNTSFYVFDNRIGGYGKFDDEVKETIQHQFSINALNLDRTYTAKGFSGMKKYLVANKISNKNVLFIHTGGTPLFFIDNCDMLKG